MVTITLHRFTIKHLSVIKNITCLSSKSTRSPTVKTICSVQTSSLSCKTLPMIHNNSIDNNYLNCNLPATRNHLIHLRLYSTDNNQQQHPKPRQQQQSTVNSDPDITLLQPDKILMRYVDELIDFREKKPTRTWLTVIKVLITMFAGVNFGAFMARLGATLLEKYEIFVRDDDDSDD